MHNAMQVMQQYGKTFALAAKLLTPASRQHAAELYAFARTVDDWVDNAVENTPNTSPEANIIALQHAINNGQAPIQALLNQHAISNHIIQAFLNAQLHDKDGRIMPNEQALIDYSYGVAGSIGAMMRPILGAKNQADAYAVSLGIAMQLTNIARDVVEDAARNRIYIPATFFVGAMSPQTLLKPSESEKKAIFTAIQQLLTLAERYYTFAQQGYMHIPFRNRLSIAAAASMYRGIGMRILARGATQYWQGRCSLGLLAKIIIGTKALVSTCFKALFQSNIQLSIQSNSQPTDAAIAASIQRVILKS